MGFMDKIKGAVKAVTGGAANVTLQYEPQRAIPGQQLLVRVEVTSTGGEVKSKGLFIDLKATETVNVKRSDSQELTRDLRLTRTICSEEIQIAPGFTLGGGETKQFEVPVTVPQNAQPSYHGSRATCEWKIRARVDAFGNDPDSGFASIRIG